MKMKTCGQRVSVAGNAHCQNTKYCGAKCPSTRGKMVCGSDANFYSSECEMRRDNCG